VKRHGALRSALLRVDVTPGRAPSERWVTFTVNGSTHSVAVGRHDVDGDALKVTLIADHGDEVEIELPQSAVAGPRIAVPKSSVFMDEPPSGWAAWALLGLLALVIAVAVAVGLWGIS
jgi:hypothetical protein